MIIYKQKKSNMVGQKRFFFFFYIYIYIFAHVIPVSHGKCH